MPKQWILTTLYILLVYAVIHGVIIYARSHPIKDERPPATSTAPPSVVPPFSDIPSEAEGSAPAP